MALALLWTWCSSTTCDLALQSGWKLNKSLATWKFSTANGPTEANEVLPIFIKELNTTTYPLRMGKCPDVLSVGLRAMSKMVSFDPFVLLPRGMIIVLVVINDVPFLIPGTPRCQPRPVADKEAQKSCGYSYIN